MDSVVKPLLIKVKNVNTHFNQVVQDLSIGDPRGHQRISDLSRGAKNVFSDFKKTIADFKSRVEEAPGYAPNVGVLAKMLAFFIQEVILVTQLFMELMKLVNNIFSLNTIIQWFMKDIIALQQWLNKKKLWLERALARTRQKILKNVEWIKRKVTVKINKVFCEARLKFYKKLQTKAEETAAKTKEQNAAAKAAAKKPRAENQSVADYAKIQRDAKFADSKQKQSDDMVSSLKAKVADTQKELDTFPAQLQAIEDDKKYWKERWSKEEAADRKELLEDKPKFGAHH